MGRSDRVQRGVDDKLSSRERLGAFLVGGGLLGAGIVAVFLSHDGSGALAIIAGGALFVFVGLTGATISRFKFGDNEVVLSKVRKAQQAYGRGDDAAAEEIVDELVRPKDSASALVPAALLRSQYQASVMSTLRTVIPKGWALTEHIRTSDYRFDGLITSPDGKHIVVEIFVSETFTGGQLLRSVLNAGDTGNLGIHGVLVVAASASAPGVATLERRLKSEGLPSAVVPWHPDEPEILSDAVTALVREVSSVPRRRSR